MVTPSAPENQSFRIHGGECVVCPTADAVHVRQSFLRHHHLLTWLVGVVSAIAGADSLLAGWRYTAGTGALVGWPVFVPSTGIVLGLPLPRRIGDRYRGYTSASTIQLSAIETVTLTNTEIRWYPEPRRTVPVCIVRYRVDGETYRRRSKLPLRSGRTEVQTAVDAFEAHGIPIESDRSDRDIPASPTG